MLDIQGSQAWSAAEVFLGEQDTADDVRQRARQLATAAYTGFESWDRQIGEVSRRWDIERMGLVDRNLIRLALSELADPAATPPKVAIDEAIELAKEFGTAESPGFVNGVLDAVWRKFKDAARPGATE